MLEFLFVFLGAAPIQAQYQIFFMKKLWMNTIPGKDSNADQIFYYHQELPKYLRGFHKCTKEDAIKLGALILRTRVENYAEAAAYMQNAVIKELIPIDLLKAASGSEWKKHILGAYMADEGKTAEVAKLEFLKTIYQWPTFGSTFFDVKQTSEPTYPEVVLIAINKKGVNIIHPHTKVNHLKKLCFFCANFLS